MEGCRVVGRYARVSSSHLKCWKDFLRLMFQGNSSGQ